MRAEYLSTNTLAKFMLALLAGLSLWAFSGVLNADEDLAEREVAAEENRKIGQLAQAPVAPASEKPIAPNEVPTGGAIIMEKDGATAKDVARDAKVNVTTPADAKTVSTMTTGSVQIVQPEAAQRMVEQYFNGLTTMQADFSQSVTGEAFASEGSFYLKRPRQFLFQYDTPTKQKVVSTGTAVYYVDQSKGFDGQTTQLPMSSGLGRIFGAKMLDLKKEGLTVTEASQSATWLRVKVRIAKAGKDDDQAGLKQATLSFDKLPGGKLQLRRIEALDTLGATTTVALTNIKTGVEIPAKLFVFKPAVYENRND